MTAARLPVSRDLAAALYHNAISTAGLMWALTAVVGSIAAATVVGLFSAGWATETRIGGGILAACFAVMTLATGAVGVARLVDARREVQEGISTLSGTIAVRGPEPHGHAAHFCTVVLGATEVAAKRELMDSIWRNAVSIEYESAGVSDRRSGLLPKAVQPVADVLLFGGSVDYAPRSKLILRVQDADGVVLWQDRGAIVVEAYLLSMIPRNAIDAVGVVFEILGGLGAGVITVMWFLDQEKGARVLIWLGMYVAFGAVATVGHLIRRLSVRTRTSTG